MDNTSQDAKLDSMSEDEIRDELAKQFKAMRESGVSIAEALVGEETEAPAAEPVVAEIATVPNVEIVDKDLSTDEEKAAAKAKGWKDDPKDVDPNKTFVSAKEFLARADLMHEKNKYEKETKELRDKLKALEDKVKLVEEKTTQKSLEELNKQRLEAISAGDTEAFLEADAKYQEAIKQIPVQQPEAREIPIEGQQFVERNKDWFNDDPKNKHFVAIAQLADQELVNYPHFTKAESYAYIENRVKEVFPDKFKPQKAVAAVSPVEAKHTPVSSTQSKRYVDLSAEEKSIYSKIKAMDDSYTVDEFLNDIKPDSSGQIRTK